MAYISQIRARPEPGQSQGRAKPGRARQGPENKVSPRMHQENAFETSQHRPSRICGRPQIDLCSRVQRRFDHDPGWQVEPMGPLWASCRDPHGPLGTPNPMLLVQHKLKYPTQTGIACAAGASPPDHHTPQCIRDALWCRIGTHMRSTTANMTT